MRRDHYHLALWTAVFVLLAVAALIVFSPGYWEYQQIRWRTKLSDDRIEAGMVGMLATTKATEELLGHGELTSEDFRAVSADLLREMKKASEYNDLAMVLRVGYLNRLRGDPSGEDLKHRLFEEIANDVAERIDDESTIASSLRIAAYGYTITEPEFKTLLLKKINNLDRLRISKEQAEMIEAEQDAPGQPAARPESK